MAKFPALPLFTDAYLADTRHLTTLQHGAYLLLLMTAWRTTDCSLPNDDVFLARCACMDKRTWANNRDAVLAFWSLNDEQKWVQGRLLDERKYVEHVSSRNSAAGRASALKRNNRRSTSVQPNVNESSTPTPTPIPINKERLPNGSPKKPPEFDEFWKQFPKTRPGSKDKALAAWRSATARATPVEIMAGLRRYVISDEVARGFAKGAAAWLNDDRWTSDYSSRACNQPNSTTFPRRAEPVKTNVKTL